MRKLCLVALLAGALSQTSGCIISTDDDDPTGRFFATWSLTSGNTVISCAEAGADRVKIESELVGTGEVFRDIYDCGDGQGTTDPLPIGPYDVTVTLLAVGMPEASNGLLQSSVLEVDLFDREIVSLGEFEFPVFGAPGDIEFTIDYGQSGGSNCGGGVGGSRVDDQNITVFLEGDNQCFALELALPSQQNVSNICNEFALCEENDAIQALLDVPPGDYEMVVEGLRDDPDGGDPVACFAGVVAFTVDGDEDLGILGIPSNPEDPTICG